MLRGCNFSNVLRLVSDCHKDKSDYLCYYKYFGECYIHGTMDGEALTVVNKGDLGGMDFMSI